MDIKKIVIIVTVCLVSFGTTSCRLGEILSEADPETKADMEDEERIPQMEQDYEKKNDQ